MSAQGERLTEVRDELRGEIRDVRDELRGGIRNLRDELRGEIQDVRDALKRDIAASRDEARQEASKLRVELTDLRGSIRLLQWQMVPVYGGLGGLFWMMFRIAAKVGALPG